MTNAIVMLWGTRIGSVIFDENRSIGLFEYSPSFINSGIEVSPIVMPLSERTYEFPELNKETFHGLPGLLADSLPDKFGNAVINEWLSTRGRTPQSFNPVERLCYTGTRGMGALEFFPATGPDSKESESIQVSRLVELAEKVLKFRKGLNINVRTDSLEEIIKVGTSAGGARAKAVIAWNEKTGDIRSGQIPVNKGYGYWLMKFGGISGNGDKEEDDNLQYPRIEYAYYLMATKAGIDMSECKLLEENGRAHFMTRRFDRDVKSGDKIHMLTLGSLAHFDFNLSGQYAYEDAAVVMRKLGLSYQDYERLFRRMVFNVLAWNHDDHVKNISFLMNKKGEWSLSPAYDVTYSYNPNGLWTSSHQMTINGKQQDITLNDLVVSGQMMGIRKNRALSIISEIVNSISNWEDYAQKAGLPEWIFENIGASLKKSQLQFGQ